MSGRVDENLPSVTNTTPNSTRSKVRVMTTEVEVTMSLAGTNGRTGSDGGDASRKGDEESGDDDEEGGESDEERGEHDDEGFTR